PMQDSPIRKHGELATIVYTSGSTGQPKGVMLSFNNIAYAARGGICEIEVHRDDRVLSYLPLSHVFERFVVEMGSLCAGFRLGFGESVDSLVRDLKAARPTLFLAVRGIWSEFQLGVLEKRPKEKLDKLLRSRLLSKVIKKKVLK